MSGVEERWHEAWLGLVQPVDGLVVSVPVLVEAQCLAHQPPEVQRRLAACCHPGTADTPAHLVDVPGFLALVLGWPAERLRSGDAIADTSLYVPEGGQVLRPSLVVTGGPPDAPTPLLLVWDLGGEHVGLPLDKPETATGPWEYPAAAKLDRLLRHTRVPIGVLTNRTHVRLIYAPHGESSGSITFRVADLLQLGGRPILDALVMLLGATRLWSVAPDRQLPAILAESRKRQANVTNELADQVFEALQLLLRGFESAAERDGHDALDAALAQPGDHLYGGLLTQLLRLVFTLYAEDRGLLPVEHPLYAQHLSVLGLFEELQADHGNHPDSMARRFGAYDRLTALCRAIYLGVEHGTLQMPARRGTLFSPDEYPFLEGRTPDGGAAPIVDAAARAAARVPSVDDETVYRVLEKLLVLRRQRLSYRALDVEQIGSVYEALMGYHVVRLAGDAVCLRPSRVWVTAAEVLEEKPATRVKWLQETTGMAKGQAEKVSKALASAGKAHDEVLEVLAGFAVAGDARRTRGSLVLQPGPERRRTSSHYTPRSLTAPIVKKTLEPLFAAMGEAPPSARILNLKVCDPAMGSGAFLVEACRWLADQVVLAWTREGRHDLLAGSEDATLLARRLVAQRCLYGVDKNPYAVNLAKLSLWLVTLAKDLPFTFVDHALRCGDSLVGLSLEQITAFHWRPSQQLELCQQELEKPLREAIDARERILELAGDASRAAQQEKEWLLRDAEDALDRVRMIGDLVVGAFFAAEKDKAREAERLRRLELVLEWLRDGGPPGEELVAMREDVRRRVAPFHWMAEYPEVFWAARPDPLDGDKVGEKAWIDAFVGNPPFLGGSTIWPHFGAAYRDWLLHLHTNAHGNGDLCAHFFRRATVLLGDHGTIGLIATNTISQGDTRATGLQPLLSEGLVIYDAVRSMPWPGAAAVSVSLLHLAKGLPTRPGATSQLDGVPVASINSRLRQGRERPDPVPLARNAQLSFKGATLYGLGFLVSPSDRNRLVLSDARNAERLLPYLGGEDLNTSPTQAFDRYAIYLTDLTLEQAEEWPELLQIVRDTVKPERDQMGGYSVAESRRANWWKYGTPASDMRAAVSGIDRCLVTARVTKHLCFTFQPTNRLLNDKIYVFPFERNSPFAVLQSRVHETWTWLLSSTMKTDLNYSASDCFETFPFPEPDPRATIPALEDIGRRLYDARAAYMVATQQGLTQTYNKLKDPACHDPDIVALRDLHLELDRAVLTAYGWADLFTSPLAPDLPAGLPPYTTPVTDTDRRHLSAFEDAVIDRLFALNATRAAAESPATASSSPPSATGDSTSASSAPPAPTTRGKRKSPAKPAKPKPAKPAPSRQKSLLDDD